MPISINPIFPVIAAQGAAPDVVLQPGTVIDAQVLKILANDLVRIAIANLSIEVLSEIPLQVGQTLQLAVSQTPEGIKLAVVGQGTGNAGISASAGEGAVSPNIVSPDLAAPAAKVTVSAEAKPVADVTPPKNPLTPLQAIAVSAAAQTAATRQGSLAPLFANLERGRGFRCASGKTAAGGRAIAGVAAEPRPEPHRQRREGRLQKLRPLSGVIACVRICSAVVSGRRARPQGGADRASPNAAVARAVHRKAHRRRQRAAALRTATATACASVSRHLRGRSRAGAAHRSITRAGAILDIRNRCGGSFSAAGTPAGRR